MDTIEQATDDFSFWRAALASGGGVETDPGNVRSGYYRLKGEALAFWRDADRVLRCWRSGDKWPTPTRPDEIEDLFAFAAPHPISYEAYLHFQRQRRWPDEVESVAAPDPALPPHEALTAEIDALRDQANGWIAEIKTVSTQAHADKCGNFSEAFAALEKRAIEIHRAEKDPHLKAGRAVDAMWIKPIIERAASLKKWAKEATEPFLIAKKKRLDEEEAARRAEAERIEKEAADARVQAARLGLPPPPEVLPPIAPPLQKAVAGTGRHKVALRTRTAVEVVDWRAFLTWLGSRNDLTDDFREATQRQAKRLIDAGTKPPGVEVKTETVAA